MGALPIVEIDGKTYFVDERLQELRNTEAPWDTESIELAYAAGTKRLTFEEFVKRQQKR